MEMRKEAGAKSKWLCALSRMLPATSGILAVKYAELPQRYVSEVTFDRVANFRGSAAGARGCSCIRRW
jgi:hypothetical protein